MKTATGIFKLLTDVLRIRILLLLDKKELSVCQLMGITGASQPLISRNLSLLYKGGFLGERRHGKLRFYSITTELSDDRKTLLDLLRTMLKSDTKYIEDMETLRQCGEFQKNAGTCDMKTLREFMEWKKQNKKQ